MCPRGLRIRIGWIEKSRGLSVEGREPESLSRKTRYSLTLTTAPDKSDRREAHQQPAFGLGHGGRSARAPATDDVAKICRPDGVIAGVDRPVGVAVGGQARARLAHRFSPDNI